ncbi:MULTISPECIES: nucleoside phosphorylase [unclassified Sedimentibacter]|uniref:nucleoside phosphorylase n=1 Tax=unclassified Sedimentibacter TaxID=2649220 RepID=UPI0027E00EB9|nr:nucleoside phosphorylase [Sedimentibacter sp. MB35-C1]WMJ76205.1 nucleoside phosphorylase [Sedimentibacter sp. MB35-C1]
MSIVSSFDINSEEVLKATDVVKKSDRFPKTVVVTFKDKVLELVKEMNGSKCIGEMNMGYTIPIYEVTYKGKSIAVYNTLLGGAGSAACMEEVIARGGEKFIFFGSCGTLDKNIAPGHFIIPSDAYRDEGTSYHYAPEGDYINVKTASKISEIFEELKLPNIITKTWTTDALYRETRGNMEKRKSEGCLAVDMECASVMAVGQFRNVDVFQFLYAEDTLDGICWDSRTMGKVPSDTYDAYLRTALNIAAML